MSDQQTEMPDWFVPGNCVNVECWLPRVEWALIVAKANEAGMHPSIFLGSLLLRYLEASDNALNE